MEQVLKEVKPSVKIHKDTLMKVHKDFKKWCEEIKKRNGDLTLIQITKLIVRHNSSGVIKGDIIEYER